VVRDNTSPGYERRRNDGPEGYNFSVEIQCDGARRAALLECTFLESIGDETKQRANLVAGFFSARQRAFERCCDTFAIDRQGLPDDLLFATREVVVDRAFGSAAASDELIDSCPAEAGLPHEKDRGFQKSVLRLRCWYGAGCPWHGFF